MLAAATNRVPAAISLKYFPLKMSLPFYKGLTFCNIYYLYIVCGIFLYITIVILGNVHIAIFFYFSTNSFGISILTVTNGFTTWLIRALHTMEVSI